MCSKFVLTALGLLALKTRAFIIPPQSQVCPSFSTSRSPRFLLRWKETVNPRGFTQRGMVDDERYSLPTNPPSDLSELVNELLEKGVRIPRYASRSDLERLWTEQSRKPKKQPRKRRGHKPIRQILLELDALGVDYPPGASPKTLELLLQKYQESESPAPRRPANNNPRTASDRQVKTTGAGDHYVNAGSSTADILQELHRRNIRFPPTATRQELEEILLQEMNTIRKESGRSTIQDEALHSVSEVRSSSSNVQYDQPIDVDSIEAPSTTPPKTGKDNQSTRNNHGVGTTAKAKSSANDRQQQKRRRPRRNKPTTDSIWPGATSTISDAAERAARKARYAARIAKDFFAEDEDGIRDVAFEYVTKENIIIDVTSDSDDEELTRPSPRKRQQPRRRKPRNTPSSSGRQPRVRVPSTAAEPKTNQKQAYEKIDTTARPRTNAAAQSNLFRLPPAEMTPEEVARADKSSRPRRRRRSSTTDSNRRIYSPYDNDGAPAQVYRDSIDRLGDFFATATDTILWGNLDEDEDEDFDEFESGEAMAEGKKKKKRPRKEIDWRDRVEERLDSMLGIHENGDFYSRWAEQREMEDGEEEGTDAFSVAQGRSPKRRHERRNKYDKPFWERGNWFPGLFRKKPPKGYNNVRPGNLLPLFKSTSKSLLSLATNACEWASVRGSLPQPVVVIGVASCVLSARPGMRLMTLAMSIVAFRIVGELIHEGLYGGEDWEDDYEEEMNEEDDEPADDGDLEGGVSYS